MGVDGCIGVGVGPAATYQTRAPPSRAVRSLRGRTPPHDPSPQPNRKARERRAGWASAAARQYTHDVNPYTGHSLPA